MHYPLQRSDPFLSAGKMPLAIEPRLVLAENGLVEGVTDLLDGSFQLVPKQQALRRLRIVPLALAVVDISMVLLLVVLAAIMRNPGLLIPAAALLLVAGVIQVVFRRFLRPPVLKADSLNVTCIFDSKTVVVPRAELKMIFQGQVVQRARYTAWVQSYLFGVGTGKVMFSVPALWFSPEAVAAFAERLRVPVRGDFTKRVTSTILHEPDPQ